MKQKIHFLIFICLLMPFSVFAEQVIITVNGMVCSFCAQGIKKSFEAIDSVESVDADLESKLVTINTKKNQTLDDSQLKKVIIDAGYDVVKIERKEQK